MPPRSGIAFVVVVHLDPSHVSLLPQILQKRTQIPVKHVQDGDDGDDGELVQPDHVYIIPPDRGLSMRAGRLHLSKRSGPQYGHLPIDAFLQTLAQDQQDRAVAIILSGTGSDGSQGIAAVKDQRGRVMVQDPATAAFDGMPDSAIATGLADDVLPPDQMPQALLGADDRSPGAELSTTLQQIYATLRARTGHDFSLYKKNTILRRIQRRMNGHGMDDINAYLAHLHTSDQEPGLLFNDLLIGVTSFFRDPEAFDDLQAALVQHLVGKPVDYPVRVWVPGCATGQEAYSIAMLLHDCMDRLGRRFHLQVFGTDLDQAAIDVARTGVYPPSIVAEVSPSRLKRYFSSQADGRYRIVPAIRDVIVFAIQNMVKDPPFTKLDLLSCRNLLIYLGPALQRKLFPIFHYSIKPHGLLFLGSSETLGASTDRFAPAHKASKVFRRISAPAGAHPVLDFPMDPTDQSADVPRAAAATQATDVLDALLLAQIILKQSATPPCVVIDSACDLVYVHGHTGRYLEPAQGQTSVNILQMARPGLRDDLATAIRNVSTHKQPQIQRGLTVDIDGETVHLDLVVKPILEPPTVRGLMMVVFDETAAGASEDVPAQQQQTGPEARTTRRLRRELEHTRQTLQATIEKLQTSNEELQSTNEELQSTNEELETSKEELQSLNEESVTVNAELQARIDELSKTNADMKNLLDSTEIATIFLDTRLCVRRFTQGATAIIPLTEADIGRPIRHLACSLVDVDLAETAQRVLGDLAAQQVEVSSQNGRSYTMRVRPYRTLRNQIDGVVITCQDITEHKHDVRALAESEQRYRLLSEMASDCIVLIDPRTGAHVAFNQRAHELLGYTRKEFATLTVADIDATESPAQVLAHLQRISAQGSDTFLTRHRHRDGSVLDVQVKKKTVSIDDQLYVLSASHVIAVGPRPGPAER